MGLALEEEEEEEADADELLDVVTVVEDDTELDVLLLEVGVGDALELEVVEDTTFELDEEDEGVA